MAKKTVAPKPATKIAPVSKTVASTTAVRNSPIPKAQPVTPARREVTHAMISQRAYDIYCSGCGGGEIEHWLRAERELKGL
ncbi:MAG TPA: DUF2934 domain-containing protein [Acidobacteriaceae bacterium]|nr:DUF2934 domain-containing protein [Acidobacteriaceae bacterium]